MSRFPIYQVYQVVPGDFMHTGGYAPGWYFDTANGMKGPYRTEAIARRVCTRWRNERERARRRAQIANLAYLSEEKAEEGRAQQLKFFDLPESGRAPRS
jgi:hypothetical protein